MWPEQIKHALQSLDGFSILGGSSVGVALHCQPSSPPYHGVSVSSADRVWVWPERILRVVCNYKVSVSSADRVWVWQDRRHLVRPRGPQPFSILGGSSVGVAWDPVGRIVSALGFSILGGSSVGVATNITRTFAQEG